MNDDVRVGTSVHNYSSLNLFVCVHFSCHVDNWGQNPGHCIIEGRNPSAIFTCHYYYSMLGLVVSVIRNAFELLCAAQLVQIHYNLLNVFS